MPKLAFIALSVLALASVAPARAEGPAAKSKHQTGTPRPVLAGDYEKKVLARVSPSGQVEWEHPIQDIHDVHVLPNGNVLFQTTWTQVFEVTPEKKGVWEYDAARMNGGWGALLRGE